MWSPVTQFFASFFFGFLAAILPIFNNEAYAVATLSATHAEPVSVVLGLGLGNGLGKTVVLLLVRAGKRLPWWKPIQDPLSASTKTIYAGSSKPSKPMQCTWWRTWIIWMRALTRHVEKPRWGIPLVACSAATSIPPIYPVTLMAGMTRMPSLFFSLAVTLGSIVRVALIALTTMGVLHLF